MVPTSAAQGLHRVLWRALIPCRSWQINLPGPIADRELQRQAEQTSPLGGDKAGGSISFTPGCGSASSSPQQEQPRRWHGVRARTGSSGSHSGTGFPAGRRAVEQVADPWAGISCSHLKPTRWHIRMCAQLSTSAGRPSTTPAPEPLGAGKEDRRERILGSNNSRGVESGMEECPEAA